MTRMEKKLRGYRRALNIEIKRKKLKGETVGAVHPSENQPFSPYHRTQGVTLARISNIDLCVKLY